MGFGVLNLSHWVVMRKQVLLLAAAILFLIVGFIVVAWLSFGEQQKSIANFGECVAAGNPVQESYPRRCSDHGKTFTEDIGNALEKQDLIRLGTPVPNQLVKSPLEIKGEARGSWFFEASFPVKIVDGSGKVLGRIPAQTTADWMTDNFVPFNAILTFEASTTAVGKLILEKDNPSGLAENADFLEIPIKYR